MSIRFYKRVEYEHECSQNPHEGFTLVELLVVIGIIALLIGVLLPSLSRAQQASKAIRCQAQLHDIGLALLSYADEHNGYLFPRIWGPIPITSMKIQQTDPFFTKYLAH